ncbi:MAG: DUF2309 family protein, partial [Gammaproteobacteria bacterium]|nr:DUF2309 family protein [Gammaproteobacteria bacterium]
FIHHNTLHAFEAEPFEGAVVRAARLLGTEPFLPESRYRQELAQGRIRESDIEAVLAADISCPGDATVAGGCVLLRDLYRALLLHAVREESDASVRWTLTESDAVERLRPDLPAAARQRLLAAAAGGEPPDERRVSSDLWHACVEALAIMRSAVARGASTVRVVNSPSAIIVATGSEVGLALAAASELAASGTQVNVVSMPSWEVFEEQDTAWKESVFPAGLPVVSVEAGSTFGWGRYADKSLGIDRFGASAPGAVVMDKLGVNMSAVVAAVREVLK